MQMTRVWRKLRLAMHLHRYEQMLAAGTCPGNFGVASMQCKVSVLVKLHVAFQSFVHGPRS